MPLATFKLRIDPEILEVARIEAKHKNVSLSVYIASAVAARTGFDYARRGGEGVEVLDRYQDMMLRVTSDYFGENGP